MSLHHMLRAAVQQQAAGLSDPYFEYNTLLLTGDGTNGAQNNTFLAANGAAQGPFADPAGYWSVGFDGSGDYLQIANNSALNFDSGDMTAECWVYLNTTAGTQTVASKWQSGNIAWIWQITSTTTTFYFGASASSFSWSPSTGTWYHLAISRASGSVKFFVNGTQTGSTSSNSTSAASTSAVAIGANIDGPQQYLNGYISNFRLVKGAAVYTSNFTPSTTPLTAISGTSLLTCQSNVICDTSSNKFAITTNGNAAVNSKSPFTISSTYNPYSFSGYFDGTGDYLTVGGSFGDFGTSAFTVEAWVYPTSVTGNKAIFTCQDVSTTGWEFFIASGGTLGWYAAGNVAVSTATLALNQWAHVVAVRSGTTITLYINGVSVATASNSTSYTQTTGWIGHDVSNQDFAGYISNARVVKGTAVYNANFTPSNSPLTAISGTSLLTCQSSTFVDNSPNAFTITVNGNTAVATASNSQLPITRNGNTTQGTFSPYGNLWSNYFDGSGDYLTVPDNAAFAFGSSDFTIEGWINISTSTGIKSICSKTYDFGPFLFAVDGTTVKYWLSSTGSSWNIASGVSGGIVSVGSWAHVALVRNGTSVTAYVNGVAGTTTTTSATLVSNTVVLSIGADQTSGSGFVQFANGYISNLRIVKGTAVYTSNFTPSTTPLTAVSGTSLLTCQSNRFIDNSSNNFTLTVNGNTSVQRFSPFNPTAPYSTATIGGSGYFDGTGDYLNTADNSAFAFGTGDLTVECWFYPTSAPSNQVIIDQRESSPSGGGYSIECGSNLIPYLATSVVVLSGSIAMNANSWNHVCYVRSGTTLSLYVNGARSATATNSTNLTSNRFTIAAYTSRASSYAFGYITDTRLIKGSSVYNPSSSTITIPTAPLTAVSNTSLLCNMTNAGIPDAAMMNDLETVGNAQVSTSVKKYGTGSLAFDGTGDYLYALSSSNFDLSSGNFTIEAWAYFTSFASANGNVIVSKGASGSVGSDFYSLQATSGGVIHFYFGSGTALVVGSTLSTNTWYHIAVTRSGSSFTIYVNGTSVGTGTSSATLSSGGPCIVGSQSYSPGASDRSMYGYIDDLRITKGYARYTANFTPPTAALPVY